MAPVISSRECLRYRFPGHPERPERVGQTLDLLLQKGFAIAEPRPATDEQLLSIHFPAHLRAVRDGLYFDADTPHAPEIDAIARLSAGAAVQAARQALDGEPSFSLMRPPGHHAGNRNLGIGGFCYFNNIAIAAADALKRVERVAILDIDVHHGNGTEDIFHGDSRVLFCSLHQSPLYPGSGLRSDGNCLNFPLAPGTGEADYLSALDRALEKIRAFDPQLLGVSAGFDTFRKCPLASLALEVESYEAIGRRVAALGLPRFAVLEGGYADELPQCILSFLGGFMP